MLRLRRPSTLVETFALARACEARVEKTPEIIVPTRRPSTMAETFSLARSCEARVEVTISDPFVSSPKTTPMLSILGPPSLTTTPPPPSTVPPPPPLLAPVAISNLPFTASVLQSISPSSPPPKSNTLPIFLVPATSISPPSPTPPPGPSILSPHPFPNTTSTSSSPGFTSAVPTSTDIAPICRSSKPPTQSLTPISPSPSYSILPPFSFHEATNLPDPPDPPDPPSSFSRMERVLDGRRAQDEEDFSDEASRHTNTTSLLFTASQALRPLGRGALVFDPRGSHDLIAIAHLRDQISKERADNPRMIIPLALAAEKINADPRCSGPLLERSKPGIPFIACRCCKRSSIPAKMTELDPDPKVKTEGKPDLKADRKTKGCPTPNHDIYTYNTFIDVVCKFGNMELDVQIVSLMPANGVRPNVVTYSTVIDGYSKLGHFDEALNLFEEMKSLGIQFDRVCYNTLLSIYMKTGRYTETARVCNELEMLAIEKDTFTYNSLINRYGKQGRFEVVSCLIQEMRQQKVPPSVLTYSTLIDIYLKAGMYVDAANVFLEFHESGLKPDVVLYSCFIDPLSKNGLVDFAVCFLNDMMRMGIKSNVVTYNAVIDAFGKSRISVEEDAVRQDSGGREGCGNQILKAFGQLAKGIGAPVADETRTYEEMLYILDLFQKMIQQGVKPNVVTFSAILNTCSRCKSFEDVSLFSEQLCLFDNFIYGVTLGLLVDCRDVWIQSRSLFDELRRMDRPTSSAFYNALTDVLGHFEQRLGAPNLKINSDVVVLITKIDGKPKLNALEILINGEYTSVAPRVMVNNKKEKLSIAAYHSPNFHYKISFTSLQASRTIESISSYAEKKLREDPRIKVGYLLFLVMLMCVGSNIGAEILSLPTSSDTVLVLPQFKHIYLYDANQEVLKFLAKTRIGVVIGVLNIQLLRSGRSQAEPTECTKFIYNVVRHEVLTASFNDVPDLKQGIDPWVYKIYEFMDAWEPYTTIVSGRIVHLMNETWEDLEACCRLYLVSHLEDKVVLKNGGIDTTLVARSQAQLLGLMQPHSIVTQPCSFDH